MFGYEFLGVIILELPDKSLGEFIDSDDSNIDVNQILSLNEEIRLKLKDKPKSGMYYITFAGVVKEPDYDLMSFFTEENLNYPNNSIKFFKDFYTPKTLIGKKFKYKFNVTGNGEEEEGGECYPSCLTCYSHSKDDENHLCKICKPDYYFMEDTYNCYQEVSEHYYFDEENEIFSPCYTDCLTCAEKEINSTSMNCLSCEDDYNFYDKSKNCLKCPKYVNYLQTECINEIPDGYYLNNEVLGTIEKCHELCKTCKSGPYYKDDKYYMNCASCLYVDIFFNPTLPGDCPSPNKTEEKDDDQPVDGECPRHKPILKNDKCQLVYCTKKEFDDETCKILNSYIKIQWLNNFHIFDEKGISYIALDINENGDLFFMAQKEDEQFTKKYIFGFKSNGEGFLFDKAYNNVTSYKTISYQFSSYTDKIKYIEINNEEYLLNILKDKNIYLIDIYENEVYTFNSAQLINEPYSIDKVIKLKDKENTYLLDYIYCSNPYVHDKCFIRLINYKINSKNNIKVEQSSPEKSIQVNYKTKITCVENQNLIQCTYTTQNDEEDDDPTNDNLHILGLFNRDNLQLIQSFVLENNFTVDEAFDSMIQLKEMSVIAYSIDSNKIHVLFKKISKDSNNKYIISDCISDIPYININEDSTYEIDRGSSFKNSLFQINDEEFLMLISDYKNNVGYSTLNTGVIIIHFIIYNNNRNILVRHYKIDFSLYNMFIDGDIMGYKLNNFLGILVELTSPEEKYISRAAFLTFGYVNTTEDISVEEGTKNLINYKKNIKISNYITGVENNLFGYDFIGVKISSLPEEDKAGYFINLNNNKEKIKINDIIDINSELSFVVNDNPTLGEYVLSFYGVLKEPNFQKENSFAIKVENYPSSSTPERYLNGQKTLYGKEFKYKFALNKNDKQNSCFKNCETCIRPSNNINEQDCIKCKEGFYFKEGTNNCYDKIEYEYYFNKEKKVFSSCYRDCHTCDGKEISFEHMNCKSCHNLYKFYEKSTNCLKCSKYVNYLQTECIDTIPEGYYLENENMGTIQKCHSLCKTCLRKPEQINNQIYMNCETCLYENKNLQLIKGNCPESPSKEDDEKGKEGKSGNNIFLWMSVSIGALIIIVIISVIIIKKCCGNKEKMEVDNNIDYYNISGKNIPFEDENNLRIN